MIASGEEPFCNLIRLLIKKTMIDGNYDSSFCQMKTYYKDKEVVITPPEDYYVSLIYKITENDSFSVGREVPVLIDPTRAMNTGKYRIFVRDEVQMHHLSYVRNNIRRKLENSSSINAFKNRIDSLVKHHENWTYPNDALMAGTTDKLYKTQKVKKLF
jgi:hypothetical protein